MPLYEFRCNKCGNTMERIIRTEDEDAPRCPKCCGNMERLVSAPTFHLQGKGWAKDGYG